jgi:hypothetical protein
LRSAAPRLVLTTVALLLVVGVPSWAASAGEGDLFVTFDGGLSPSTLPRNEPVPVAVRVAGNVRSATGDADHLPQLRRITVAINRQGRLYDRGLPVCRAEMIQPASEADARAICRGAVIGHGHVTVQVRIRSQLPYLVPAGLLAFNGPLVDGKKTIVAQVYAKRPPGSFILTFKVERRHGLYGTVLSTTLPQSSWAWAYLLHFDMTLGRTYVFRGQRRSFVSAACGAPRGFDSALFPFARARYRFAEGEHFTVSQTATCRVAGE